MLQQVPQAAQWARSFTARLFAGDSPISREDLQLRSAPFTVHAAVEGIALGYIPRPDQMLRDLLVGAISECAGWLGRDACHGTAA